MYTQRAKRLGEAQERPVPRFDSKQGNVVPKVCEDEEDANYTVSLLAC